MALATRCPHCQTTFRVAHDQLKLRAGLVRCGACKEIFNGIEHLLRPDETAPATSPATPAVPAPSPAPDDAPAFTDPAIPSRDNPDTVVPEPDDDEGISVDAAMEPEAQVPAEELPPAPDNTPAYSDFFDFLTQQKPPDTADPDASIATQNPAIDPNDPLQRMTLMDFRDRDVDDNVDDTGATAIVDDTAGYAAKNEDAAQAPDPLDEVIEDLQRKPHRRARGNVQNDAIEEDRLDVAIDDGHDDAPGFVMSARRKQRFGRLFTVLMSLGCLLLLAALLAQAMYAFRDQLAVRYPQAKPALLKACALAGCRIGLPMQIDELSIESNELQAATGGQSTYVLSTLLRNRAPVAQRWPHIELTLNDAQEKPVARRVFTPAEYLATTKEIEAGFQPGSEQVIKLTFALADLKPAGYRVYLFYP